MALADLAVGVDVAGGVRGEGRCGSELVVGVKPFDQLTGHGQDDAD